MKKGTKEKKKFSNLQNPISLGWGGGGGEKACTFYQNFFSVSKILFRSVSKILFRVCWGRGGSDEVLETILYYFTKTIPVSQIVFLWRGEGLSLLFMYDRLYHCKTSEGGGAKPIIIHDHKHDKYLCKKVLTPIDLYKFTKKGSYSISLIMFKNVII